MPRIKVKAPSGDAVFQQGRAYAILKLAGDEAGAVDDQVWCCLVSIAICGIHFDRFVLRVT